jgi:NTE family protein
MDRIRKLAEMKSALTRLLAKLPPPFKNDPDVQKLAPIRDVGEMTIARLTNRGLSHAGFSMDYEFSRATVKELWATGLEDVRRSVADIEAMQPTEIGCIARLYDLPPGIGSAKEPAPRAEREGSRRTGARARTLRHASEESPRSKRLRRVPSRSPASSGR